MSNAELPAGWAVASLAELVSHDGIFTDGDWVESKDQDPDGDIRLTQLADVGEGTFRDRSNRSLTSDKFAELRCTQLQEGDVLVARMPDPLGRACLYPGSKRRAVTVVDVCILRVGDGGVYNRWLMWAINAPQVRTQIQELQTGTTRKRISRKNLEKIKVAVPPLAEQHRIVEAVEGQLSRLQVASVMMERSIERTGALWGSVLNLLAGGNLLDRAVDLDMLTVAEVAEVSGGIQKQKKRAPVQNVFPFLRVANVGRGKLDLETIHEVELFDGELERYRLKQGDLLVVEGNGSPSQIGRAARWSGGIENAVHQNHLIRVRPGGRVLPRYLELVWNSPFVVNQLREVAGSTSGLYTLSVSKLKAISIPVPSLSDQADLVESAEAWETCTFSARVVLEKARRRSESLRKSILSQAASGQLTPQNSDDEPASALLRRLQSERKNQNATSRRGSRRPSQEKATSSQLSSGVTPPLPRNAVQTEIPL